MFGIDSWIRFALTELFALLLLAFVFRKPLLTEKRSVSLKILLVMLAMYLAQLFYLLLSPTYFFRRFAFSTDRVNAVPFRALSEWLAHPFNFFGNVLLFLPLGFFEVLLHPTDSRKMQLGLSAATAAMLSLFVEFAQCFNYRVPDIDDIILNTLGGTLGALVCILQQRLGFDRTRVGRVLLPRPPRTWHRHNLLNRFCILLVAVMETALFTVNYIVTIPRPAVLENTAVRAGVQIENGSAAAPGPSEDPVPAAQAPEKSFDAEASAHAAMVYDTGRLELEAGNVLLVRLEDHGRNDEVIFASGSGDPIYPASTLKMLTALTVLDIAQPEDKVTLGMEIYIPPLDASRAGLEYGMTMTVYSLLEGLLLPSGADAAYALGVYCGRKLEGNARLSYDAAIDRFVDEMNRKAASLGAGHTTAVNVVGLDAKGQLTTAEDILLIAQAFLDQPVLAGICCLPSARITSEEGKSVSLTNTNKMLLTGSAYYNGAVAGVKTGTTSKAGNCLVSVFTVREEEYLCVVMNSSYYGKFTDTQKLFEVCAQAR